MRHLGVPGVGREPYASCCQRQLTSPSASSSASFAPEIGLSILGHGAADRFSSQILRWSAGASSPCLL